MSERIFKRKLYETMLKWKSERNGSTALLIKGARRVGKSTLAEEFAKNEYESYILIDFVECKPEVKDLFIDISDLNKLFFRLQFLYDVQLKERKSVIIFDEVQNCPPARQAIKKLVKDGRYDYIETGSLITLKTMSEDILIPSEEERVSMHPMDFEEFCWALNDEVTPEFIRQCFDKSRPLGSLHQTVMTRYCEYLCIGGMPQVVAEYAATKDISSADLVKRDILKLYRDDIA